MSRRSGEVTVGIVGTGLIGKERLKAIRTLSGLGRPCWCVGLCDPIAPDLRETAERFGVQAVGSLEALLDLRPDWVVVATPHDIAPGIAEACLRAGRRVLVEKPLGRSLAESRRIVTAASEPDQLWIGFNYRFFAGLRRAMEDHRRRDTSGNWCPPR